MKGGSHGCRRRTPTLLLDDDLVATSTPPSTSPFRPGHCPCRRRRPITSPSPSSKPRSYRRHYWKPTDGECPVGKSKPTIMIAASSPFQIHQGRKPMLITRRCQALSSRAHPTVVFIHDICFVVVAIRLPPEPKCITLQLSK
ncbi:hypothetical protein ACLOJK_037571, partial [Asimina triloba]